VDFNSVREQLKTRLISSEALLSGTKMLDEGSRQSPQYKDAWYLPFYYHLGKQIAPVSVLQIGAKLGLVGACFLRSCQSVNVWVAMDEGPSGRFVTSNLRLNSNPLRVQHTYVPFKENLECEEDDAFQCDLALLTEDYDSERYRKYLEFLWRYLKPEGLLVADYISSHDVFQEFCRVANREPELFSTRYGVGIIQR
jgi:predicted O-methyltransferase YrrM